MSTRKVSIITGASSGIGKAVAVSLATKGYHVVLISRSKNKLEQVKNEIEKANGCASIYILDVSNVKAVKKCAGEVVGKLGKVDLLFNNAGILKHGTTDLADDEIDELIKINLNGAIYIAKYVAKQMKIQKDGYIINLSSMGGKIAASFAGVYAASKFGLSGYSEALSKEMSLYGVKVTNICPAMVATDMVTKDRNFPPEQMLQVSDIIKTVDYLLSLSKSALPFEIVIGSLPFTKKLTKATYGLYGLK